MDNFNEPQEELQVGGQSSSHVEGVVAAPDLALGVAHHESQEQPVPWQIDDPVWASRGVHPGERETDLIHRSTLLMIRATNLPAIGRHHSFTRRVEEITRHMHHRTWTNLTTCSRCSQTSWVTGWVGRIIRSKGCDQ